MSSLYWTEILVSSSANSKFVDIAACNISSRLPVTDKTHSLAKGPWSSCDESVESKQDFWSTKPECQSLVLLRYHCTYQAEKWHHVFGLRQYRSILQIYFLWHCDIFERPTDTRVIVEKTKSPVYGEKLQSFDIHVVSCQSLCQMIYKWDHQWVFFGVVVSKEDIFNAPVCKRKVFCVNLMIEILWDSLNRKNYVYQAITLASSDLIHLWSTSLSQLSELSDREIQAKHYHAGFHDDCCTN